MKLLLDLGNSRLKWATENQGKMSACEILDYRRPEFIAQIRQQWHVLAIPEIVAISSVAEREVLAELLQLIKYFWPQIKCIVPQSEAFAFGVQNAYPQPHTLGIDRWLALIAAHAFYPGDVCVADCGTAITLDAIQADGLHLGGVIAPGLMLMKRALAGQTAALEFNLQPGSAAMAQETALGIANGVLWAAAGLISQTLQHLPTKFQLIMTGGDADKIRQVISIPVSVDEVLVLKGLSVYAQSHLAHHSI